MNYIKQLTEVMGRFSDDERLNPTHVSLYLALFLFWNLNRFRNPISISRSEVMRVSKIGSNATYHRCIRDLNKWKYLEYIPSKNPFKGSLVNMFIFEPSDKQAININSLNTEQVPEQVVEQALVPYINSINNTKSINKDKRKDDFQSSDPSSLFQSISSSKKSKSKDDLQSFDTSIPIQSSTKKSATKKKKFTPPELDEVKTYFKEKKSTSKQADMFFNHFESTGWVVGGRASMKNWKAAARNWITRSEEYHSQKMSPAQQRLHVNENKDYDIPL